MADAALTLWYNFASSKSLQSIGGRGPTLGIVRTTERRVFGPSGLVETIAAGVAGFDHDPITGRSLGLLVEEARTNICLQSEDFSTTWVTGVSAVLNTNQTVAPDGTLTADQIIDDGGGGTSNSIRVAQNNVIVETSTAYVFSSFCQADGLNWTKIGVPGSGSLVIEAFFDLINGVIGATTGADNTSEFIEDVSGGRFRCGEVFTTDAVDTTLTPRIAVADGDNDTNVDRDGTSSIFTWGVVLEKGAFPTSYIKTEGSTVTRNADVVSTTDVSWLNAIAGTFYADFSTGNIDNDTTVFSIHDGTANERIAVEITGGNIHFIGVDGSVTQWDISTAAAADTDYKLAVAWAANDIAFYLNGSQVGVDGLATLPTLTKLNISSDHADAEFLNKHQKEDRYYNVRKINQFLEDLSNGLISESGGAIYPIGLQSDLMFGP